MLVEVEALPEVVAEADVEGELLVHADVVLRVVVVLLDRRLVAEEAAKDRDVGDGRSLHVLGQRVLAGETDREVAAQDRLVDVVRADLEVVAHRAPCLRPGEVVLVLPLDLHGRLRRVHALSHRDARGIKDGRIVRVRADEVLEVRVLEDELIELVRAHLPGVADQGRVVLVRDRAERAREDDRAGAVLVRVLLVAVAHLQELLGSDVAGGLGGQEVVLERSADHRAVETRIDALGVDEVIGAAVQTLAGDEEVRAVLDDRTAE